jgi:hypothetical protein
VTQYYLALCVASRRPVKAPLLKLFRAHPQTGRIPEKDLQTIVCEFQPDSAYFAVLQIAIQRAQRHAVTSAELTSSHATRLIQTCQPLYLRAATTTNHRSRLSAHKQSPSQIFRCQQVRSSDAYLEIGGKVLATLSIFLLVHKPDDGWKVMAAQCVGCVVAHGVTVVLAYREVGFQWPTPSSVWNALRLGGAMFLFRAVQGLSGSVNGLILGSVAPVAALGEYAGAERITRVFQQGMWPVNQALYPKLTHQMQNDPNGAIKTVRLSLLLLGGLGLGFGLALFLGAPLLVHLALGPAFKNSVPVCVSFPCGFR